MLAVALPVLAQTTVIDAFVKHWQASGEFTIAVAGSMLAELQFPSRIRRR